MSKTTILMALEADRTLRETGHLIPKPSSLGRKACCDVELGGQRLGGQHFMSYIFHEFFPSMNWKMKPEAGNFKADF